jgi:aspartyl/asparaginyl beta-hydroxylase (cupin superfamily)
VINDVLAKIPSTFERVRFMKIKANSGIGKHSDKIDKDFGLEDGNIVRFHVPIRTNDKVKFFLWEGKKQLENYMETGHYYYIDARAPHSVVNNSDVDRIHLVIDVYVNDEIRKLLGIETFW